MSTDNGGERERLAPVIPLFGGPAPERPEPRRDRRRPASAAPSAADDDRPSTMAVSAATADETLPFASPDDVPVDAVSLAAPPDSLTDSASRGSWHPTWADDRRSLAEDVAASPNIELAEKALLKKLRTRSLSVSEARGFLREYDLDAAATDHVLASLEDLGYLDDAALAEQLVHAGVGRKGQGRQVIAQTLSKRGIPRDAADAALAALPDDDLERALEFARTKARSLRDLDRDTALRRLIGQLARRGYGGSIAMTAARTALDEGTSSGVRFR